MVASGSVNVKPLITHTYTLEETLQAFERAKTGEGGAIKVSCRLYQEYSDSCRSLYVLPYYECIYICVQYNTAFQLIDRLRLLTYMQPGPHTAIDHIAENFHRTQFLQMGATVYATFRWFNFLRQG